MILEKNNPETVEILCRIFRKGGTAVLPCDTIYGLCAMRGTGEEALRRLKGRDAGKPFLVISTTEQAEKISARIPGDILKAWPAPLTVVLNAADGGTAAVRVPADPFLQTLLSALGEPLLSTSVNISGEPPLLDFTAIKNRFEAAASVLVRGAEVQGTLPSTLIDVTVRPYRLLRQGAYDASLLISNSAR